MEDLQGKNPQSASGTPHGHTRTVMIVDDDQINREMLGFIIQDGYHLLYAENGLDALNQLRSRPQPVSLLLIDLKMPVMDGFELMQHLREDEKLRQIPVIVLTSETDAEVDSLQRGAVDFIKKPYDMPTVIRARVERIIELAEDRRIINSVETDSLTGMYNKEFFFEYASDMDTSAADGKMDALVIDLDHFHLFNEMHGRAAGDEALCQVADAIREELEKTIGICCRCEADTFFIYCAHRDDHQEMLERIAAHVSSAYESTLHLRMGVCTRTDMVQDILGRFDRALAACNSVRGNYLTSIAFYDDELYRHDIHAQRLVNEMRDAIRQKQFRVYFQPKYDVSGEKPRLRSAEALVRWQHPEFGLVSPGLFIPLFEQNGMIRDLDSYVWQETSAQIAAWRDKYGRVIPVSVNVSRIDLFDADLLDRLNAIRDGNRLPGGALLLEITESAYTEDTEQAISVIRAMREHGYAIEMDDFGSGYSSLNMLLQMPVDAIKIDGGFMRAIAGEQGNAWLFDSLVDIARHLSVPTIFEGVENENQYRMIRKAGGDVIQGYYFSKPLPAEQFEQLIEKDKRESQKNEEGTAC